MKKGFTLVELAIVLVIIGIIMGMAIKGKSLIDVARVRGELAKVKKIETAVATYVAQHEEKLPDEIADLLNSDLIQPGDVVSIFADGHTFDIVRCARDLKPNFLSNNSANDHNLGSHTDVCVVSDRTVPHDFNFAFNFSKRLACHIEMAFDDKNVATGLGRDWFQMINAATKITAADYEDCDKLKGIAAYGYIVF